VPPDRFGEDDTAWIDYAGGAGTVATYSFSRVANGTVDPAAFRGRVVVVGASAPSLQDLHPTSISASEPMPGPEIHANAISTALRGLTLRDAPAWLGTGLIMLFAFACPLLALGMTPLRALAATAAVGVVFAIALEVAFADGLVVPFVAPITALTLGAIATVIAVLSLRQNVPQKSASDNQRV
jgi:adenylate cyclase